MDLSIIRAIDELQNLSISALRQRYQELFGEVSRSSNKQFLVRRIAWRLQADALGGLSQRALQRIAEIADDRDLRTRAPHGFLGDSLPRIDWSRSHDRRLPPPGTLLTRRVGNRQVVVKVLRDGFEYESRHYRSLSAIAREVTGTRWNGLLFFGLAERRNG